MFKDSLRSKPFGIMATALILFSALSLAACGGGGGSDSSGISGLSGGCVSGGSGLSAASPYVICTAADLAALAYRVNSPVLAVREPAGRYYLLGNDIDLSEYGWDYNDGKGWIPIGNNLYPFRGYFDGNGKTVSSLYIYDDNLHNAGLFGVIFNGYVKNTGINNAYITGGTSGGAAGWVHGGSITNCHVTGRISGGRVGGIAADVSSGGSITNCYFTGKVSSESNAGGVVGGVSEGDVTNSYATGEVSGYWRVGGVAGFIGDRGSVSNCYATSKVSGNQIVGGVAGGVDTNSSLTNSYATGEVSGEDCVGGIAGDVTGNSRVILCAALNPAIMRTTGSNTNFGRVVGQISSDSAAPQNMAWDEMVLPSGALTGEPGTSINKTQAKDPAFHALAWPFGNDGSNPWASSKPYTNYPLPVFYWQKDTQISFLPKPIHLMTP